MAGPDFTDIYRQLPKPFDFSGHGRDIANILLAKKKIAQQEADRRELERQHDMQNVIAQQGADTARGAVVLKAAEEGRVVNEAEAKARRQRAEDEASIRQRIGANDIAEARAKAASLGVQLEELGGTPYTPPDRGPPPAPPEFMGRPTSVVPPDIAAAKVRAQAMTLNPALMPTEQRVAWKAAAEKRETEARSAAETDVERYNRLYAAEQENPDAIPQYREDVAEYGRESEGQRLDRERAAANLRFRVGGPEAPIVAIDDARQAGKKAADAWAINMIAMNPPQPRIVLDSDGSQRTEDRPEDIRFAQLVEQGRARIAMSGGDQKVISEAFRALMEGQKGLKTVEVDTSLRRAAMRENRPRSTSPGWASLGERKQKEKRDRTEREYYKVEGKYGLDKAAETSEAFKNIDNLLGSDNPKAHQMAAIEIQRMMQPGDPRISNMDQDLALKSFAGKIGEFKQAVANWVDGGRMTPENRRILREASLLSQGAIANRHVRFVPKVRATFQNADLFDPQLAEELLSRNPEYESVDVAPPSAAGPAKGRGRAAMPTPRGARWSVSVGDDVDAYLKSKGL